jgi:hypothetical protein
VAVFLAAQIRRLIVGFSVDERVRARVRGVWKAHGFEVYSLIAVWTGPHKVMVATKVKVPDENESARRLAERMNAAEAAVRTEFPAIAFSFVEPDVAD